MRPFLHRIAISLAAGYIFYYFSEVLFWAGSKPEAYRLQEIWSTWVLYSILAYFFLTLRDFFHADSFPAVFLCGALFGWLAEGVAVQTMYDHLPFQIIWTGVAWHALLTIGLGWYLPGKWAGQVSLFRWLTLFAWMGLLFGFWAVWWWVEEGIILPPLRYLVPQIALAVPLLLAYPIANRLESERFQPSLAEYIILGTVLILYFIFVTVPAAPLSPLIFPLCAGSTAAVLWKHRQSAPTIPTRPSRFTPLRSLAVMLIPITAGITYTVFYLLDARLPTGWIVYILTFVLGLVIFSRSVWAVLRKLPHDVSPREPISPEADHPV